MNALAGVGVIDDGTSFGWASRGVLGDGSSYETGNLKYGGFDSRPSLLTVHFVRHECVTRHSSALETSNSNGDRGGFPLARLSQIGRQINPRRSGSGEAWRFCFWKAPRPAPEKRKGSGEICNGEHDHSLLGPLSQSILMS